MDIQFLAGMAGIGMLFYVIFIGQRSIPELLTKESRRQRGYFRFTSKVRKFWDLGDRPTIDIVCSEIPHIEQPYYANPLDRNYLRYAKFADLDTLIFIHTNLSRLYPHIRIQSFSPSEYVDHQSSHIIVIGGPPWNILSAEMEKTLPYRFINNPLGQDDPLHLDCLPDHEFSPRWDERGNLISDIALIARIARASEKYIYLFVGCLTAGVLCGAYALLDDSTAPGNIKYLSSKVGNKDFILVFEAHKEGGVVKVPQFSEEPPLALLVRKKMVFDLKEANAENYKKI